MYRIVLSLVGLFGCIALSSAQDDKARAVLTERASREFSNREYAAAERDFRELTMVDPSNLLARAYLGHALFRQEKYSEAIGPYEKARELERSSKRLPEREHRVLVDQLVMAYGLGGQLLKARTLAEDAIKQDPKYPMNYYNLACAFAEEGDKGKVLVNLDLAFQRKANVLDGEQIPDPRLDSSFQRYADDSDFARLMKKLGYK